MGAFSFVYDIDPALQDKGAAGFAFEDRGNFLSVTDFSPTPQLSSVVENKQLGVPPQGYTLTFTPEKFSQSLTFPAIADKTLGSGNFQLTGEATSGLPVVYSHTSSAVEIDGNTVSLLSAGQVTITALQNGNTSYKAAEPISKTFCVNPSRPVISIDAMGEENYQLRSSSASGNQWFKNNIPLPMETGQVLTAVPPGRYTVKVIIDGCASQISEQADARINSRYI